MTRAATERPAGEHHALLSRILRQMAASKKTKLHKQMMAKIAEVIDYFEKRL